MKIRILIGIATFLVFSSAQIALGQDALQTTRTQIAEARETQPDAFAAVAELRAQAPVLDQQKRGRFAVMGPMLKSLGPDAMMALIDELVRDEPFAMARPSTRTGWRVGLVHAIGRTYDPRARAALEDTIQRDDDLEVVRASAMALGKLLDDDAAKSLISLARGKTPRAIAVLGGMGTCRRNATATYLAARISSAEGPELDALIQALRDVGNVWAWKTPRVAASGEAQATRGAAAQGLMTAFLRFPDRSVELTKALLIVDADSTMGLITTAKQTATRSQLKRLKALETRLASNPLKK